MNEHRPTDEETRQADAETKASAATERERLASSGSTGDAESSCDSPTMETPSRAPAFQADPPKDLFAGYTVIREIHRGGQGVVYQAVQQATRRKVAIKVMKEDPLIGPAEVSRFEREVQLLGQLNHPNIVAIHESGEIRGVHFFVMDYISGQPLDRYTQSRQLSIDDTLRLFTRICEGTNAAHLRGIIHRDLKPSNIRVDADGEPHILDFGLAKTLSTGSESSLATMTGQFLGSPPWASPEQAEAVPGKVDIRTDVYALGVIFYQMLTDRFPYSVDGNMAQVLDNIRKAEPVRPSTIRKQINNEIETIVLKCLAKECDRRYQSAGEIARDLGHYLLGEPIEAKRDSAWYVIRKMLRRRRMPVVFGFTLLVLLIGFAISMTVAYGRVREEARRAELVAGFLDSILTSVDPGVAQHDHGTPLHQALRDTLDEAVSRIDELEGRPEVQARVRTNIGRVYMNLGLYSEAKAQFRLAHQSHRVRCGNDHPLTAETFHLLGWAHKECGEYTESEEAYREALRFRRDVFGDDHISVSESLNGLGQLYFAQGMYETAEPLLREALELRRQLHADERDLATSAANLGSALRAMRRLSEAEPLLREALALRRELCGDAHFHTVVSMNKLALLLREQGELAPARELFAEALRLRRELLGGQHPHVGVSLNNLALTLFDAGQYDQAAQYFTEAIDLWRRALPPEDLRIAQALVNLAATLRELGDLHEATARCEEALAMLPEDSPRRGPALFLLARLRIDQGELEAAESLLRSLLPQLETDLSSNHPALALARGELGRGLVGLERFQEAEALLLASYEDLKAAYGDDHHETIRALQRLVGLYTRWDKPDAAIPYRNLLPAGSARAVAEGELP